MTDIEMEGFLDRFEHLLDAKLDAVVIRIQAVDDASIARVTAVAERQSDQRGDIRANTKAIGELTAQTARVEREMQAAVQRLKDDFRDAIHEEIQTISESFVHRDEIERRSMVPVERHERRVDRLEKLVVLSLGFAAGSMGLNLIPFLV